ncbi:MULTISPECIES: UvrD-helicase domain-containing protein [Bacillus]|nr:MULTISPECIES: ATP-dependent helicase [Bacillus subtilis group]MCY8203418.1 ATP-dependent helicase [Bacillus sp. N12A5]MCY8981394.1 ATP-dependent helicase [Bacillus halotolerans]MEC1423319.1 ATP-dependent helicase [Bacillus subtilis]MEC1580095.1 ATP-dependent helicase [Bacillus subtilis]
MLLIDNEKYRREIIEQPIENSIVVHAGPGSGKTTLLIQRLKYIIENRKKSYSGIACITYTNAAKDEIISRLQKEQIVPPKEFFIGTIHSFLYENVIKPYSHLLNQNEQFKVTPIGFVRGLKREVGEMLNKSQYTITESELAAFESLGHDKDGRPYCFRGQIPPQVAKEWKKMLKQKGYIDQQTAIYVSYEILKNYEHIKKALSLRFPFILMDEYQDVTYYQDKVFSLLTHSSFFCVGDANQSIFSFTGAEPFIFTSKDKDEKFKRYNLINNFRSTSNIVQFTNRKTDIIQNDASKHTFLEEKVLFITNKKEMKEVIEIFQREQAKIKIDEGQIPFLILTRRNKLHKQINQIIKESNFEVNPFLDKLKNNHYRRYLILKNLLIAIAFKKSNQLDEAINYISESLSYLFFNTHPAYIKLTDIQYDAFMWKRLNVFTLLYIDSLDITQMTPDKLFVELKEFISETSEKIFERKVNRKLLMLNYDWKGVKRIVKTIKLSELIESLLHEHEHTQKLSNILSIHSAKGMEAECVLVLAETQNELNEWLANNQKSEEARIGYVAFSRARKLLCIWAPSLEAETLAYLQDNVKFI